MLIKLNLTSTEARAQDVPFYSALVFVSDEEKVIHGSLMILILIFKSLPGVSLVIYFTLEHLVLTLLIHTGKQEMFRFTVWMGIIRNVGISSLTTTLIVAILLCL